MPINRPPLVSNILEFDTPVTAIIILGKGYQRQVIGEKRNLNLYCWRYSTIKKPWQILVIEHNFDLIFGNHLHSRRLFSSINRINPFQIPGIKQQIVLYIGRFSGFTMWSFSIPEQYFRIRYIFKIIQIVIAQVDSTYIHSWTSLKILNNTICEKERKQMQNRRNIQWSPARKDRQKLAQPFD